MSFDVNKDSYLLLADTQQQQQQEQQHRFNPKLPSVLGEHEIEFRAAGLLPFINVGDDVYILVGLERRGEQSLCLGLCGGRRDNSDVGSLHTAVREFEEETGYILQNFLGRDTIWRYPYQSFPTSEVPGLVTVDNSTSMLANLPPVKSDMSLYLPWAKYCVHLQSCGDVEFPEFNRGYRERYMNRQLSDDALELSMLWKWANALLLGGLSNHLYYNLPAQYVIAKSYTAYSVKMTFEAITQYLATQVNSNPTETRTTTTTTTIPPAAGNQDKYKGKHTKAKDVAEKAAKNDLLRLPHLASVGQPRLVYPQFPYTHIALEHCLPPQFPLDPAQRTELESDMDAKLARYNQQQLLLQQQHQQNLLRQQQYQQKYQEQQEKQQQQQQQIEDSTAEKEFNPYMDEDDEVNNQQTTESSSNNNDSQSNSDPMALYNQYLAQRSNALAVSATSTTIPTFTPTQPTPQTSIRSLLCWLLPLVHHLNNHILPPYELDHKKELVDLKGASKFWKNELDFNRFHPAKSDCSKQLWPSTKERSSHGQFLFRDQFPLDCESEARRLASQTVDAKPEQDTKETEPQTTEEQSTAMQITEEQPATTMQISEEQSTAMQITEEQPSVTAMGDCDAANVSTQPTKANKKKNKKEKAPKPEFDLSKYFFTNSHPILSAYQSYNSQLSPEAIQFTKCLINSRALEQGLTTAAAVKKALAGKQPKGSAKTKGNAVASKDKPNANVARDPDFSNLSDPASQQLILDYRSESHVDKGGDLNQFSLLISTPTPKQQFADFEAAYQNAEKGQTLSADINNRFVRKVKFLAEFVPPEAQFKHPFLQRLYNQMIKQRFFAMKSKQLQASNDAIIAQTLATSNQYSNLAQQQHQQEDDNRDEIDESESSLLTVDDTEEADDANDAEIADVGETGMCGGDRDDRSKPKHKPKQQRDLSKMPSDITYNVTELFPKPNSKYYASDRSRLETEVGFDSMVSLHWVSVKSLIQRDVIAACTPFGRFLQDKQWTPHPSQDVHSPDLSQMKDPHRRYDSILKTFLRGKTTTSRHLAVTSTGFTFPVGIVLGNLCSSPIFAATMANMLEQRYNMFNQVPFQPYPYLNPQKKKTVEVAQPIAP